MRLPEVEKSLRRIDGSARRITSALIFAVLLLGGVALRISNDELGTWLLIASAPFALHASGLFRLK
jgi:hypothetical protein